MSISQILSQDNEPRPCAGFDESLVLAVKDCFLESDMREILIGRVGVGVMFFSRQCTSLATDKKVCSYCDHWFTQISQQNKQKSVFGIENFLDNHLDVDKENSDEGKKATRRKYLKRKSRHAKCQEADGLTGSKAVCEQCGALVSSNNMKQHVRRVHSNHNNLSCEHCDKQFKYRSELLVHLTHHTGELNYSCSACGKKFRRAGEARLCEKGHRGLYNFVCDICQYRTHKKHHLDRHLNTHSKSTPYLCPLCGFKSGRKDNLKQHVEKRHCNASNSIKQLEELYPEMYKLHETSDTIPVEMNKQSKRISVGPAVVDTEERLESFSDPLPSEERFMAANQFTGDNMPRYLTSSGEYFDRYTSNQTR